MGCYMTIHLYDYSLPACLLAFYSIQALQRSQFTHLQAEGNPLKPNSEIDPTISHLQSETAIGEVLRPSTNRLQLSPGVGHCRKNKYSMQAALPLVLPWTTVARSDPDHPRWVSACPASSICYFCIALRLGYGLVLAEVGKALLSQHISLSRMLIALLPTSWSCPAAHPYQQHPP